MKTVILLVVLSCAAPAFGQTYVSAALGAELSRSYESEAAGRTFSSGNGEVVSWALRAGTALGSRWGVELEFNRPGIVERNEAGLPIAVDIPLSARAVPQSPSGAGSFVAGSFNSYPSASVISVASVRTEQRNTTWNTSAWVGKSLGPRADLVFLAGIGFSRVEQRTDYGFGGGLIQRGIITIPSSQTRAVNYGVGPLAGLEARIRMLDHLTFTPGMRVQSLGNNLASGLLLRPSVALGWSF